MPSTEWSIEPSSADVVSLVAPDGAVVALMDGARGRALMASLSGAQEVVLINQTLGVRHRAFQAGDVLFTAEECNTDQIVSRRVVPRLGIEETELRPCQHCLKREA